MKVMITRVSFVRERSVARAESERDGLVFSYTNHTGNLLHIFILVYSHSTYLCLGRRYLLCAYTFTQSSHEPQDACECEKERHRMTTMMARCALKRSDHDTILKRW